MKKSFFTVTGMSCAACSASVERAVNNLPDVESATVNLTTGKLNIICNMLAAKVVNSVKIDTGVI